MRVFKRCLLTAVGALVVGVSYLLTLPTVPEETPEQKIKSAVKADQTLKEASQTVKDSKDAEQPQKKEKGSADEEPPQIRKEPQKKGESKYVVYEVTAYTAGYESTGKTPDDPAYGITASGERVKEGRTLACPPELKFGTKVYIPYFNNTYVCTDRGGAIKGNRIDVYMENLEDALEFGRRFLKVRIID